MLETRESGNEGNTARQNLENGFKLGDISQAMVRGIGERLARTGARQHCDGHADAGVAAHVHVVIVVADDHDLLRIKPRRGAPGSSCRAG